VPSMREKYILDIDGKTEEYTTLYGRIILKG
jgi:hypothetical protein